MISKSYIKRRLLLLSSMFHAKHVNFVFFLLWLSFPLPDCVQLLDNRFPFLLNSGRWLFVQKITIKAAYSVTLNSNPYI